MTASVQNTSFSRDFQVQSWLGNSQTTAYGSPVAGRAGEAALSMDWAMAPRCSGAPRCPDHESGQQNQLVQGLLGGLIGVVQQLVGMLQQLVSGLSGSGNYQLQGGSSATQGTPAPYLGSPIAQPTITGETTKTESKSWSDKLGGLFEKGINWISDKAGDYLGGLAEKGISWLSDKAGGWFSSVASKVGSWFSSLF